MEKQKEVRELLNKIIDEQGIKQKFIAEKVGLDTAVLSKYKVGKIELWESSLEILENWLKDKL